MEAAVGNLNASVDPSSLVVGIKCPVEKNMNGVLGHYKAEVLAIKEIDHGQEGDSPKQQGHSLYYVHYMDFNKRLDEWVELHRLNLGVVEWPTGKSAKKRPALVNSASSVSKSKGSSKPQSRVYHSAKKTISFLSTGDDKGAKSQDSGVEADEGMLLQEEDASPFIVNQEELSNASTESNTPVSGNPVPSSVESYRKEMENLRRGGSMTLHTEELARVKNVTMIEMGAFRVHTWYFSPYPEKLLHGNDTALYLCETCLEPFEDLVCLRRHRSKCVIFVPPGNEIYRSYNPASGTTISLFEVDGHKQKAWCRNLCLLSKLFLDHKTLYYDVDPFLFYVLTNTDTYGCHLVGYFSKEKQSLESYNVACILTLPQYQRKGYGKLLISLSYELNKIEGVVGSPEKPLSDLGLLSYRSYWAEVILDLMIKDRRGEAGWSIQELSQATSITTDDIIHTLNALEILKYLKGNYLIILSDKVVADYEKFTKKPSLKFDPKCLHWTPPTFTASQLKYI